MSRRFDSRSRTQESLGWLDAPIIGESQRVRVSFPWGLLIVAFLSGIALGLLA